MKHISLLLIVVTFVLTVIPTLAKANSGDFSGAVAIGTSYAGVNTAPSNGLIVQGAAGIGTASPVNLLDISGAAVIGASYAGTNTAPSNGLLVQGKVGIGTTTAADMLDVAGALGLTTTAAPPANGMYLSAANTLDFATNSTKAVEINSSGAITTGVWNGSVIGVSYGGTGDSSLTSNGVLYGNGTGAVQATAQGGANTILTANSGAPAWSSSPTIGTSVTTPLVIGGTGVSSTLTLESTSGSGTSDAIYFDTGSQSTAMTITTTGYVGIGTTTPTEPLSIYGPNAELLINQSTTGNTVIWLESQGSATLSLEAQSSTGGGQSFVSNRVDGGSLQFRTTTSGGTLNSNITILGNKNVGINTNAPGTTLEVSGELTVDSYASSSGTAVCRNGNVISTCSSAGRYKVNVEQSRLGLNEVLQMKPVTFEFKDHKENWEKHDFGFVAEDMAKINPLLVTYDDDGKVEGVRYMQLTSVMAKAIQEQQAEIEQLKETVKRLSNQK